MLPPHNIEQSPKPKISEDNDRTSPKKATFPLLRSKSDNSDTGAVGEASMADVSSAPSTTLTPSLKIFPDDKKQLAVEIKEALQVYVDKKADKYGPYIAHYCSLPEIEGKIDIDSNNRVSVLRLPSDVSELAALINILLKGHSNSQYSTLFVCFRDKIINSETCMGYYLRFDKNGKVKPVKNFPSILYSEQLAKKSLALFKNAEEAKRKAEVDSMEETVKENKFKNHHDFNAETIQALTKELTLLISTYLLGEDETKNKKRQQKFIVFLSIHSDKIRNYIHQKQDNSLFVTSPINRIELAMLVNLLLTGKTGFKSQFRSTLLRLFKELVNDDKSTTSKFLIWEGDPLEGYVKCRPLREESFAIKKKALLSEIKEKKEKKINELRQRYNLAREAREELQSRVLIVRKILAQSKQVWTELTFVDVPQAVLIEDSVIDFSKKIESYEETIKAIENTNKGLKTELTLILEQLPTNSEVVQFNLPLIHVTAQEALLMLKDWTKKQQQASQSKKTSLWIDGMLAIIAEITFLQERLVTHWPQILGSVWYRSYVARKIEEMGKEGEEGGAKKRFFISNKNKPELESWLELKRKIMTKTEK